MTINNISFVFQSSNIARMLAQQVREEEEEEEKSQLPFDKWTLGHEFNQFGLGAGLPREHMSRMDSLIHHEAHTHTHIWWGINIRINNMLGKIFFCCYCVFLVLLRIASKAKTMERRRRKQKQNKKQKRKAKCKSWQFPATRASQFHGTIS